MHALPQLVPNRVQSALARVTGLVWRREAALTVEATEARAEHVTLAAGKRLGRRVVGAGEAWGRLYDQRWVRVVVPKESRGEGWWLEWRDQGEATAWVEGKAFFGFDVAHRYVELPAGTREVWLECYCCQSAIWHPAATGLAAAGSVCDGAWLVRRDDEAWGAMHDLQVLFELMMQERAGVVPTRHAGGLTPSGWQPSMERASPLFRHLLHGLDAAVDALDRDGVGAVRVVLAGVYARARHPRPPLRAVLTGHAHIDLVWLWTEAMGEAKAVHTFATANRLLATYPEFRFAYSQPASYEAVGRRAPGLWAETRAAMARGQWEATGAMHVESDTLLACGEALARSFTLGQAWFQAERGAPAKLTWLPDVFGYAGCLPQLMRLAGAEWFFTTKMTWNAINRFPFSSFVWRGMDGSEVVAHVTQAVGYNNDVRLEQLKANALGHQQAAVHPELLHPAGFGDGGGGPTAEMIERARRIGALHDGPAVAWGQPEAFFARLARRRGALPVWQGECYLEYHRGTLTTHGDLKAAFRGLERALQAREAVAVARGETVDLGAVWRRLVFAQFHDYIPGSSVPEVYAEGIADLRAQTVAQEAAVRAALGDGDGKKAGSEEAWFNVLPVPWRGWVADEDGRARWLELPGLSGGRAMEAERAPAVVEGRGRLLRNERVEAEIGVDGGLARLVVDGRAVELRAGAGVPVVGPDRPANYHAWDIDRQALDLLEPWPGKPRIEREEGDGTRAVVAVFWPERGRSSLVTRYVLEAGASCLRIEVEVRWQEAETLVRLPFATGYQGHMARFGSPFGSTLRNAHLGAPAAEAQWEVPGSRWAAISHDGERDGLWLATEAKYGFSARDGVLGVTMLRSALMTGFESRGVASPRGLLREEMRSAGAYSDQGYAVIRLAVGRYDATAVQAEHPAVLAETLFTTPVVYRGAAIAAPAGYAGPEGGESLVPAWALPTGDGTWVLRLHEVGGQAGEARLRLGAGWRARPVDLLQRPLGKALGADGGMKFRPYQIVSLLVERG